MYAARTQEEILTELKELYNGNEILVEGTFAFDVFSSNAIEFAKFSLELAECYKNAFLHTCANEYLDLHAEQVGITRRAAKCAVGEVKVTGNGTVNKGAFFSTVGNVRFIATETVEISGSGYVPIEAESAGAAGNVAANTIIRIPMNIAGIREVTNELATFDGYDLEDDETLRERCLIKLRSPGVSGNPAHYRDWALSVVGVGAARVQRCWNGAGTVKVVIADSNLNEANVLLLERVNNFIQEMRPVGAIVTVVSAEILPVDISFEVVGNLDEDNFKIAVDNHFKKLVQENLFTVENDGTFETFGQKCYVSLAQINHLLIANGADDIKNLTLNNSAENINLKIDEIPKLGEIIRR